MRSSGNQRRRSTHDIRAPSQFAKFSVTAVAASSAQIAQAVALPLLAGVSDALASPNASYQCTRTQESSHPSNRNTPKLAISAISTSLGIVKEFSDWNPFLKAAAGGLKASIDLIQKVSHNDEEVKIIAHEVAEMVQLFKANATEAMNSDSRDRLQQFELRIKDSEARLEQAASRWFVRRVAEAYEDVEMLKQCREEISSAYQQYKISTLLCIERKTDILFRFLPLQTMEHSVENGYDYIRITKTPCTPGTRISIFKTLSSWATNANSPSIFWMNGLAGTGKSTLSVTLCDFLSSTGNLAASFFCLRQLPTTKLIIPTIAFQLAQFSFAFSMALVDVLHAKPDLPRIPQPKLQIDSLLVEPWKASKDTITRLGLVPTIVVDAVDECDEAIYAHLDELLRVIREGQLPGLKFFFTSRPDQFIRERFETYPQESEVIDESENSASPEVVCFSLHSIREEEVRQDIKLYLEAELRTLGPSAEQLEHLAAKSGTLFIYAATTIKYVTSPRLTVRERRNRLESILDSKDVPSSHMKPLDDLYTTVLNTAFPLTTYNKSELATRTLVVHTIICGHGALTVAAIAQLLDSQDNVDQHLVQSCVDALSAVFTLHNNGKIYPLHSSFLDFMMSEERCGQCRPDLRCDYALHHGFLAATCFDYMKRHLRFNICNLPSSYTLDDEVTDLREQVTRMFNGALEHACNHWVYHLWHSLPNESVIGQLKEVMMSEYFLFWIEAMNLQRQSSSCALVLHYLLQWITSQASLACKAELQSFFLDAWRFVMKFANSPARRSTPHLYISVLAMWPSESPLGSILKPRFSHLPIISGTNVGTGFASLGVCTHASSVCSVAFKPDGKTAIAGCIDGSIWVWDVLSGFPVGARLRGHTSGVRSIAVSPVDAGKYIISGSRDGTLRLWDSTDARVVGKPLKGHTGTVDCVTFSSDGKHVISGSDDCTIRIWEIPSGDLVGAPLVGHSGYVRSIAVSPDGMHIASGSADRTIRLWEASTGVLLRIIGQDTGGHHDTVKSVAFSPDGMYIASGSNDQTIMLWKTDSGTLVAELNGHTGAVRSVIFSPSGHRIISCSEDWTVRIWDVESGGTPVGEPFYGHTGRVVDVAFSPDEKCIISGSYDGTMRVWSAYTATHTQICAQGHTSGVRSVTFSPDGKLFASCSDDNSVRVWNASDFSALAEPFVGHTAQVLAVVFSPDGEYITSCSMDKSVRLWKVFGEPPCYAVFTHAHAVRSIAFSPDGKYIAWSSNDGIVGLCDVQAGIFTHKIFIRRASPSLSVAFSPDGKYLASGSGGGSIRIWDTATCAPHGEPLCGHHGPVRSVAFSPDGKRIVSGAADTTIRIWDVSSTQPILEPLQGHFGHLQSVSFSHNGKYIVSASNDTTIGIWDAETGDLACPPLFGHTNCVMAASFSPDGRYIASASSDRAIRLWNVDQCISPPEKSWRTQFDGWLVDATEERLCWIPGEFRSGLWYPGVTAAIITTAGCIRLEVDDACLGENWGSCYKCRPCL